MPISGSTIALNSPIVTPALSQSFKNNKKNIRLHSRNIKSTTNSKTKSLKLKSSNLHDCCLIPMLCIHLSRFILLTKTLVATSSQMEKKIPSFTVRNQSLTLMQTTSFKPAQMIICYLLQPTAAILERKVTQEESGIKVFFCLFRVLYQRKIPRCDKSRYSDIV